MTTNKSAAYETAATAFLAALNSPQSEKLNEVDVRATLDAIPAEEKADFRKFMASETISRLKDIAYYGIDPETDSLPLQNAKRVFRDDVDGPGESMADTAKNALMDTLDNSDKVKFIVHILATGIREGA